MEHQWVIVTFLFVPQLLDQADKRFRNFLIKAKSCFYFNTSATIETVLDRYESAKKIRQLQALPNPMREPEKPGSNMHLSLRGS